jgi:hypothetical protein
MSKRTPKQKKAATFEVVRDKIRGWRLSIPAPLSSTGNRRQLFYRTSREAEAAAKKFKDQRKEFGVQSLAIAPGLSEAATTAEELLQPLGIGLLEAVRRFVEIETRLRSSVPIEDACAAFRATGSGWSDSQARAYRLRCEKLCAAFVGRLVSSVTGEELAGHLEATTTGPGAYNQAVRLVRAIWRWCAKSPRAWCALEPIEQVEAKATVSGAVGILTPDQARAVMLAAETYYPECVPAFAISLFTGLRQAEVDRLEPGDISTEGIQVPAISSKTKRRRFIGMPEPLADWLAVYPIGDSVTPPDWKRKQIAVRRMAGFRVWTNLVPKLKVTPRLEAAPPDDLPEWPDNAIRHTAATVAVALGKPLEALIFEHGHSGGVQMLKRHYLGAMRKADAIAIWAMRPNGKKAANLKTA